MISPFSLALLLHHFKILYLRNRKSKWDAVFCTLRQILSTLLSCTNFHTLKFYVPDKTRLSDVLRCDPHGKKQRFFMDRHAVHTEWRGQKVYDTVNEIYQHRDYKNLLRRDLARVRKRYYLLHHAIASTKLYILTYSL